MFSQRHVEQVSMPMCAGAGTPTCCRACQHQAVASVHEPRGYPRSTNCLTSTVPTKRWFLRIRLPLRNAKRALPTTIASCSNGERFATLKAAGARPQYLLWPAPAPKNPAYSDVLYIEELVGPKRSIPLRMRRWWHSAIHGQAAETLTR